MKTSKFYNWALEHRHPIFLVGLLTFFILPEIFAKVFLLPIPTQLVFIILVISSAMLIHTSARKRFIPNTIVVALVVFIFLWNNSRESSRIEIIAYCLLFIYFSFITIYLFRDLLHSKKITASVIIGAFAGYFMIGVIYFFIFSFLDLVYPDTTSVNMMTKDGMDDMFYFSFITLTTIGYGDFTPTSSLGQRLAILEGLIGQFYIAIIMAIFVGKFITRDSK